MAGPGAAAGAKAAGAAGGRVGGAQAAKGAGAGGAGAAAKGAGGGGKQGAAKGGGSGQGPSLGKLAALRPRRRREEGEGDQGFFGSTMLKLLALGGGGLTFFLLVIVAPLSLFEASANSCLGEGDEAVPIQTSHKSDPEDLSETQIAIRVYLVGQVMKMTPRQIVTAYDVAFVESTMTNIYGGHSDSTGVFQQRNFSPWTDGGRNRNNVIDSSISFFLQLRRLDRGQPIPVLAQDVQVSAYPDRYYKWVDEAVALYNEIRRLVGSAAGVKTIQSLQGVTIGGGGLDALSLGAACSALTAAGPANLKKAVTLYQPRSYKTLPADLWAGAGPPQQVDTRIWANAVWVMRTYRLKATAAREMGHKTHGDGTALDMVPAEGNSLRVWDSTARRLALDLGWTPGCASSGFSAAAGGGCNFAPAIILVGYNGFDDYHGDPANTHLPHIHVSWFSSCYGCGDGALVSPRAWVKAFPVGVGAPEAPGKGAKRARRA